MTTTQLTAEQIAKQLKSVLVRRIRRIIRTCDTEEAMRLLDGSSYRPDPSLHQTLEHLRPELEAMLERESRELCEQVDSAIRNCERAAASWLAGDYGAVEPEFPPDVKWGSPDALGHREGTRQLGTAKTIYGDGHVTDGYDNLLPLLLGVPGLQWGRLERRVLTRLRPRLLAARAFAGQAAEQFLRKVIADCDLVKALDLLTSPPDSDRNPTVVRAWRLTKGQIMQLIVASERTILRRWRKIGKHLRREILVTVGRGDYRDADPAIHKTLVSLAKVLRPHTVPYTPAEQAFAELIGDNLRLRLLSPVARRRSPSPAVAFKAVSRNEQSGAQNDNRSI